jgi:hypothetical protein
MQTIHYSWHSWIRSEFSQQIFEKYSNIKFQENPSRRTEVVPTDGQTDRYDKDSTPISQVLKHA